MLQGVGPQREARAGRRDPQPLRERQIHEPVAVTRVLAGCYSKRSVGQLYAVRSVQRQRHIPLLALAMLSAR